ncbi:hypothetical protein [Pseudomonas abyssi]|uniref:hypothetical protein n=1 Tax=Pseudomonas abyssi TaxID=170540 RepID=UPI0011C1549A|nr:hypothetical protein [Halopseudomonas gallaeciensis]
MNPLWNEFPRIPWGSAGWRMGFGETYLKQWNDWYINLSSCEKEKYESKYPEPPEWEGFYNYVKKGEKPPKILREEKLMAEAAVPPLPEEMVISEKYRVMWCMQRYMKNEYWPHEETEEYFNKLLFVEPNGFRWFFYSLKSGGFRFERE